MASIAGDPGAAARGITHELKRLADLSLAPGSSRASGQGRHNDIAVMLTLGGENGVGYGSGEIVVQFGEGPQMGGRRLVPKVGR